MYDTWEMSRSAARGWAGENRELFELPAGSIPVVPDVQAIEIPACPRKITWPCWSLSLLGATLNSGGDYLHRRRAACTHGHASRNLTIRYSWSQDKVDRQLFR